MARKYWAVILLAVGLLLASRVWATPVEVIPGVTADVSIVPSEGNAETTVTRTAIFVNYNVPSQGREIVYQLGPYSSVLQLAGIFTYRVPPTPGSRTLYFNWPVPGDWSFIPGSLRIQGTVRPDPVITDGSYPLTVALAAAGQANSTVTVVDQLRFTPPLP